MNMSIPQKDKSDLEAQSKYLLAKNKEAAQKLLLAMRARLEAQEVSYVSRNVKRV